MPARRTKSLRHHPTLKNHREHRSKRGRNYNHNTENLFKESKIRKFEKYKLRQILKDEI